MSRRLPIARYKATFNNRTIIVSVPQEPLGPDRTSYLAVFKAAKEFGLQDDQVHLIKLERIRGIRI